MTIVGQPSEGGVAERRWYSFWSLLPAALLALGTAIALSNSAHTWSHRLTTTGVAVLIGGWMWFVVLAHPRWTQRLGVLLGYFAVLLPLTGVLVWREPQYVVFVIGTFVQVLSLVRGAWVYVGVVLTAGLLLLPSLAQGGTVRDHVSSFVIRLGLIGALGLFIRSTIVQGERRQQALAELAEAHGELAQAHAELAETHAELAEAHSELARAAEENTALQAQLIAQARRGGIREERTRMAGEIHDTLAQSLAGILTQLDAASARVDEPEARRRLTIAQGLARESLGEARRSVQALRPEPLEDAQLPEAVSKVVGRWSLTHDIPVALTVTGDARPLHPEVEVTVLRAAQEALANVARHAAATRVGLTVSYMEDVVVIDVRDNGCGFDPADATEGFGLIAMRQRVTRLGGSVTVESRPGDGTAVSARVTAISAGADR